MSGFAITTFFQLLDLIIKAIIIAIFCDIAQINYNVMYFTNFYEFINAHMAQARLD